MTNWLRLEQTAGVGPTTAHRLLAEFGLPENIFAATERSLSQLVGGPIARALVATPSVRTQSLIAATLNWLDHPDNHFLTLADRRYPQALLNIHDPPVVLYAKGKVELLQQASVAIVGSRNATAQGCIHAGKFAEHLSQSGFTIVSGMALGIDTAAHAGALPHAGSTIAVVGTGIDIVYPARNRALAHQIARDGCLLSEYVLGTGPLAANFPRRNRLISGLSRGVLVVEAAARSGSLITARVAAEQGRDVFAIPGSIHAPLSKGCHQLIKQGAKLVESGQDILEEIGAVAVSSSVRVANVAPPSALSALFDVLGFDPADGDTLSQRSGLDAAELLSQLLELELLGFIEVMPGGFYRRIG
ncbi:DNA-processing protein DprA [Actimicrobium antarcticum]|uniref:DNA-processing protein DprA n=1 Tax=Actimicrobium antarcticum TaxID=1051899 RepID=A0ABP7T4G0_9BURK